MNEWMIMQFHYDNVPQWIENNFSTHSFPSAATLQNFKTVAVVALGSALLEVKNEKFEAPIINKLLDELLPFRSERIALWRQQN